MEPICWKRREKKCTDLRTTSTKILGICFSYLKQPKNWENFAKSTQNTENVLLVCKVQKLIITTCKKTTKFYRFRGQISPNSKFFWKIGFIQIEDHI